MVEIKLGHFFFLKKKKKSKKKKGKEKMWTSKCHGSF